MTDRERLISPLMGLIAEGLDISEKENGKFNTFKFADHLISHGVTIERHGRWEFLNDYTGVCTNCHEESIVDWEYEDKFCPNCGAKMDGEA